MVFVGDSGLGRSLVWAPGRVPGEGPDPGYKRVPGT